MDYRISRAKMESAALVLGAVSIIGCACLYVSIPVGAIAIILALLSRGENIQLNQKQKLALILGIVGICATIIFYGYAIYTAFETYGSWEGILRGYADMSGLSYEEVLEMLQP